MPMSCDVNHERGSSDVHQHEASRWTAVYRDAVPPRDNVNGMGTPNL